MNRNSASHHSFSHHSFLAYAIAALFIIRFSFFFLPIHASDGTFLGALLSAAPHLLLFPLIAALPAPSWAKAAGYGWLAIDLSTDIMALNGVAPSIYLSLRFGGHVSAALWMAVASWQMKGAARIFGLLSAINIGGYSFALSFLPMTVLYPSSIFLIIWFILIGRLLRHATNTNNTSLSN